MSETRSLWEGTHADKWNGRLFATQYRSSHANEYSVAMDKVDREMSEAIAKHGKVTIPSHHMDEFYDRIEKEKANII